MFSVGFNAPGNAIDSGARPAIRGTSAAVLTKFRRFISAPSVLGGRSSAQNRESHYRSESAPIIMQLAELLLSQVQNVLIN